MTTTSSLTTKGSSAKDCKQPNKPLKASWKSSERHTSLRQCSGEKVCHKNHSCLGQCSGEGLPPEGETVVRPCRQDRSLLGQCQRRKKGSGAQARVVGRRPRRSNTSILRVHPLQHQARDRLQQHSRLKRRSRSLEVLDGQSPNLTLIRRRRRPSIA